MFWENIVSKNGHIHDLDLKGNHPAGDCKDGELDQKMAETLDQS